jgi:putative ABC transport system ATP-binding protein
MPALTECCHAISTAEYPAVAEGSKGDAALAVLSQVIAAYRREVFAVFSYALCVGLLALATPIAAQALVNTFAFGTLLQPLFVLSALVLVVLFAAAVLKLLKSWTVELLQRRMFVRTAARLGFVLPRLDPVRYQNTREPHAASRS